MQKNRDFEVDFSYLSVRNEELKQEGDNVVRMHH